MVSDQTVCHPQSSLWSRDVPRDIADRKGASALKCVRDSSTKKSNVPGVYGVFRPKLT